MKLDDGSKTHALCEEEAPLLADFIKETLGDRVGEVRVSKRLVGSPAVVVDKDTHMTTSMRRVMKMMQQREGGREPVPRVRARSGDQSETTDHDRGWQRRARRDADLAKQVAEQVFDNALVAAGLMEDPRPMLGRLNGLLEKVLQR